jgi:hypothetical protein
MNHEFNLRITQAALNACVDEMYGINKGMPILRPNEDVFRVGNVRATRKQIKHVIEQRKADGKSVEEIKKILSYLPAAIADFDFEIPNGNPKYPGSVMRIKVFKGWGYGLAIVLDREMYRETCGKRDLITAYPHQPIFAYSLLLKKLNTSAAGKTPHPKDLPRG